MVADEIEDQKYVNFYEKSIEEQLGTAKFNTIKYLNDMNKEIEASKYKDVSLHIKPSDRPDVKYYKYDLPIPNIDPEIEGIEEVFERERKKKVTTNQRVWSLLELDGEHDFDTYQNRVLEKFNHGK